MKYTVLPNPKRLGFVALCLMLGTTMSLAGCAPLGVLGVMIRDVTPVPATYELEDRPTLIIVDDPLDRLGGPALTVSVANLIAHHLQENKALSTPAITQARLHQLAQRLGDAYPQTAIGTVGQTLGAEQVIHVRIESATSGQEGSIYRPQCTVWVKLVDVVNRKRLFPPADKLIDSSRVKPGYHVTVAMKYQVTDRSGRGRSHLTLIGQQLAQRVGLEVAQLFYEHKKPPAGSQIRNH